VREVVGVTGHQRLSAGTRTLVKAAIEEGLAQLDSPPGVCSLATGADQIFAEAILKAGQPLEVVIPCAGYERTFTTSAAAETYHRLLSQATSVVRLPFVEPSEDAFFAAGRAVVERCTVLMAVWDGEPAAGLGGTADVVAYARRVGREVRIIWPIGASRE
jgi:hypothetical protein